MIARAIGFVVLLWAIGFAWFAIGQPGPAPDALVTDGIVVVTGGPGRVQRGLTLLAAGRARRLLVSGADRRVRTAELAAVNHVPARLVESRVDLGHEAVDTRSNAAETAAWVAKNRFRTVRLVTTDWHMRRARFEIARMVSDGVIVIPDAVRSEPGLTALFKEYHKYLLRRLAAPLGSVGMTAWWRTLAYRIVFYSGTAGAVMLVLATALVGGVAVRRQAIRWARYHHWCARNLLGIETRIEGTMPAGPVLFAAKHQSMWETLELLRVLDEPVVVLKRELADIPFWGRVAQMYGVIPVDREGSATALRVMLRAAKAAKADGRPILIFPEGTRVPVGETPPLRAGFAGLYRMVDLPVVAIALDSGRVWPRRGPKRAGVVTVRFGEVIPGLPRGEVEARVHAAINVLEGGGGPGVR